ncbi:MAG: ABC transporter substrate-binding protein [Dialister sp.]|nr:ABC transporter substrate-binding protein [Dialister sp.]
MKAWKKKGIALAMAALAVTGFTGGCGSSERKAVAKLATREITDIKENKVMIPADVEKIAITPIPWASITYALDKSSERIAAIHPTAMSAYKGHLLEKLDTHFGTIDTKIVAQNFSVNTESMVSAGIEACILWQYQEQDAEKLKKVGIAPVLIYNDTVDNLKKSFHIVGNLLGKKDQADKLCAYYDNAYNEITKHKAEVEKADKPTVLFIRNSKLRLQGNDNFMHEALEIGGAYNPIEQSALDSKNTEIPMEEIYKINPDVILLSNFDTFVPDDLYENRILGQDWSSVKAVQEKRVYKVPMGIYRWDAPGVETPLMMKWIAHMLQPKIFGDIDIRNETKAFYKDMFNLDVTDADLALVFADKVNEHSRPIY